jgi:hypothetical protein
MMFSALKALDPLDNKGKHSEHRDRQGDEDHVGHVGLLRSKSGHGRPVARAAQVDGTVVLRRFLSCTRFSNGRHDDPYG